MTNDDYDDGNPYAPPPPDDAEPTWKPWNPPVWHVRKNDRQFGPFTAEDLQNHIRSGYLLRGDYVWAPGMSAWVQAWTVPELFGPAQATGGIADVQGLEWVIPVKTSIWAIAAGYLGLFSVLFLPAPFALILGIVAISDLRRHPGLHGWGRAVFAVAMGAVFTILTAFIITMIAMGA